MRFSALPATDGGVGADGDEKRWIRALVAHLRARTDARTRTLEAAPAMGITAEVQVGASSPERRAPNDSLARPSARDGREAWGGWRAEIAPWRRSATVDSGAREAREHTGGVEKVNERKAKERQDPESSGGAATRRSRRLERAGTRAPADGYRAKGLGSRTCDRAQAGLDVPPRGSFEFAPSGRGAGRSRPRTPIATWMSFQHSFFSPGLRSR
jgi:hypothetical protein